MGKVFCDLSMSLDGHVRRAHLDGEVVDPERNARQG
jgi:hypothetical protein